MDPAHHAGVSAIVSFFFRRRPPTIRQWLTLFMAALIVPTLLAVLVLLLHSYGRERSSIERGTLDMSWAAMQAIDRELSSARAVLQALATSPSLDQGDLRAFHAQALDVLQSRPGNILVLTDPALRQVDNSSLAYGAKLPPHGNPDALRLVFDTAEPAVSDLYHAPTVRRLLTSVDVPVVRGGQVHRVLSLQYPAERLGAILLRQQRPSGASVTLYDGAARTVWSSRARRTEVGQRASSALAAAMAQRPEGTVDESGAGQGARVTLFSRSSISNWTVAIALPRSALNAGLWHALQWIVYGTLLLLALGAALACTVGARIHAELARRDARRVQERSEAFWRGIFETAPDAMFLVGAGCRIVCANPQAECLFGWAPGALAGQMLDDLLVDSVPPPPVCERLRAVPVSGSMAGTIKLRGRRRDGGVFAAGATAKMLDERELLIVTVRDVSADWEQEDALRHALEDKNTLLKELSHRVKNNLQLIISLFNLQARTLPDVPARQALQDAAARVRAMALVHERLYQSRTLTSIAIRDYVSGLCDQLASAASASQRGIALQLDIEPLEFGLDVAVPLGLLLNELVSNSLKHAFPDGRRGVIEVHLQRLPQQANAAQPQGIVAALDMCLTVSDDGIGLPHEPDRTSSHTFGLKLMGALSDQLHARLTFRRRDDGGACATLVFRIPGAATVQAGHGDNGLPGAGRRGMRPPPLQ